MASVTAAQMLSSELPPISTGCASLDRALHGGLRMGCGIHELCGEASAGKSQLCMQIASGVVLPRSLGGKEAWVVYISTEGDFPIKRFDQILRAQAEKSGSEVEPINEAIHEAKGRLLIQSVSEMEELVDVVANKLPVLSQQNPQLKLIVIDSIAHLFRSEFSVGETRARALVLFELAAILKRLSSQRGLCVVCTNQVTAAMGDTRDAEVQQGYRPALGLAWTHCITTRTLLRRTLQTISPHDLAQTTGFDSQQLGPSTNHLSLRTLTPTLSPTGPTNIPCSYVVATCGVIGMDPAS